MSRRQEAAKAKKVALAGNPNVGKSTIFNALTGMNQHTGNWPGKTVALAQGRFAIKGEDYILVDLPGTYSLISRSEEECVAADFITGADAVCTVVVCDATCLERTLVLALQIMELTDRVIVCVNLMDEARKKGIQVDLRALELRLGVPVVATAAGKEEGLARLKEAIREVADGFIVPHPVKPLLPAGTDGLRGGTEQQSDQIAEVLIKSASRLAAACVSAPAAQKTPTERADRILLHRVGGKLVMLGLLLGIFWLTIEGANYPSELLQAGFDALGRTLASLCSVLGMPEFLRGLLLDGVYGTLARVVSVMLPPMAIFFPLFTVFEDLGYLPRVAFLLDRRFYKSGACGKQALSMW